MVAQVSGLDAGMAGDGAPAGQQNISGTLTLALSTTNANDFIFAAAFADQIDSVGGSQTTIYNNGAMGSWDTSQITTTTGAHNQTFSITDAFSDGAAGSRWR
jgi:hypothetical protein